MRQSIHKRWTPAEDIRLTEAVEKHGAHGWDRIAVVVGSRKGLQCRERWLNHLMPEVQKKPFSSVEDGNLVSLFRHYGRRWSSIADHMPGRTAHAVKNRFHVLRRNGVILVADVGEDTSLHPPPHDTNLLDGAIALGKQGAVVHVQPSFTPTQAVFAGQFGPASACCQFGLQDASRPSDWNCQQGRTFAPGQTFSSPWAIPAQSLERPPYRY